MSKKILIPAIALGVFLAGLLAVGSYDPRHELRTLVPNAALATLSGELDAPELDSPELDSPEMDSPELDAPELDSPELDSPELSDPPELDSPELDTPDLDSPDLDDPDGTVRFCKVFASADSIFTGGSVTISWETQGFDSFTLNGQTVSGPDGSKTFTDVQQNTEYKLVAKSADGDSTCTATVVVECVPEPVVKQCTDFGFDFDVAKFEWNGWEFDRAFIKSGHEVDVTGDTSVAHWTADPAVAGVVAKAGTSFGEFAGGTSGTVKKTQIGSGHKVINHILFCGNIEAPTPECTLTPEHQTIDEGETASLSWTTEHADTVTLTDFGTVLANGMVTVGPLFADKTYTLTASSNGEEVQCIAEIDVVPEEPAPTCDAISVTPSTIDAGESATLSWETTGASRVVINQGIGEVAADGSTTVTPLDDTTYTLTVFDGYYAKDTCSVTLTVEDEQDTVPECVAITAEPGTLPEGGGEVVISWETVRASAVSISPIVGLVADSGSSTVTVSEDTTFLLTATDDDGDTDTCSVSVDVEEEQDTVPQCVSFTADRTSLPAGGGTVVLDWETDDATDVTIIPGVGAVETTGTTSVEVISDTVFTLTAEDLDGDTDSCTLSIDVDEDEPAPISCAQNVSFTASDTSIDEGEDITLNWSTNGLTDVRISTLGDVALDGSAVVRPDNDITYVLTGSDGTDTIDCPLSINVDEDGGGGGGPAHPRCELDISDDRIERGEEITLEWDTSRATEVFLIDNHGNTIFTTDDFLSDDKREFFDGELTLSPQRDTRYTLIAERGSRDDECEVEVEVDDDDIVVLETRDQQPLVAGISLSQTPYTGFEAGPILSFIFYALLVAWALFVTYVLVIKRDSIAGFSLAPAASAVVHESPEPRDINPDLFPNYAHSATSAPVREAPVTQQTTADFPMNLPTGVPPVGYQSAAPKPPEAQVERVLTDIEDLAHTHRVLLSSDALRYFAETFAADEQTTRMEEVIAAAKASLPAEDGWVVINKSRMQMLCEKITPEEPATPSTEPTTVPNGSSSLAEAIVTGNVMAAYQLIGNRPMFSLADAAADLDAAYRKRKGADTTISQLLESETAALSDEQLKAAIDALTGALDGVYTSEEEAVKMAILKAVKAIS